MAKEEDGLTRLWDGTKAFFKRSETIFLARAEAVIGVIVAGVAAMDWSPLLSIAGTSTGFTKQQLYGLGGLLVARGVLGEWARRRRTKEIEGHLVPTEEALPEGVKPVKKTK
jgi:hypothetical protein